MTQRGAGPCLTSRAFAELVGVVPETLRKWVRRGLIVPAGRTPTGQLRFSEAQVAEALQVGSPCPSEQRAQDLEAHVMASRERARRLAATLRAGQPGAGNARRP